PCLVHWIQCEPNPFRYVLATRIARIPPGSVFVPLGRGMLLDTRWRLAHGALYGFAVLRSKATPAIPDLVPLISNHAPSQTSWRAIFALGYIGTNALPPLLEVIQEPYHPNRARAIAAVSMILDNSDSELPPRLKNLLMQIAPEIITNEVSFQARPGAAEH